MWVENFRVEGINEEKITHLSLFANRDPTIFKLHSKKKKIKKKATDDEVNFVEKNDTWELCDITKGQKAIGVKWMLEKMVKQRCHVLFHFHTNNTFHL